MAPPLPPSLPSSNQPETKKAASDNTNSTMIGSDGSQSAVGGGEKKKGGGVIIDCFSCRLVLIEEVGRDSWEEKQNKNYIKPGGGVQTNQHKKNTNK